MHRRRRARADRGQPKPHMARRAGIS